MPDEPTPGELDRAFQRFRLDTRDDLRAINERLDGLLRIDVYTADKAVSEERIRAAREDVARYDAENATDRRAAQEWRDRRDASRKWLIAHRRPPRASTRGRRVPSLHRADVFDGLEHCWLPVSPAGRTSRPCRRCCGTPASRSRATFTPTSCRNWRLWWPRRWSRWCPGGPLPTGLLTARPILPVPLRSPKGPGGPAHSGRARCFAWSKGAASRNRTGDLRITSASL